MIHKSRHWCLHLAVTADDLTDKLTNFTWATCQAFELNDYLFLNDSAERTGTQTYAVLQRLPDGTLTQIDTIELGWSTAARLLEQIHRVVLGEYDVSSDSAERVVAILQKPEQHGTCPACR